jgi:hypothetical protein
LLWPCPFRPSSGIGGDLDAECSFVRTEGDLVELDVVPSEVLDMDGPDAGEADKRRGKVAVVGDDIAS